MFDENLLKKLGIPLNTPADQMITQLIEIEKKIVTEFFNDSSIIWKHLLLNLKETSTQITVWSEVEMNTYYKARNDSQSIQLITSFRRIALPVDQLEYLHTKFDDYQLIRAYCDENQFKQAQQLSVLLKNLASLGELFQATDPKKTTHEGYYLSVLLRIQDLLRANLNAITKDQKEIAPQPYLIARIDAINRLIAAHLLDMILQQKVQVNKETISSVFKMLGAQVQEVLPWLNVFFKQALTTELNKDVIINECFDFSRIIIPHQRMLNLTPLKDDDIEPMLRAAFTRQYKSDELIYQELMGESLDLAKLEAYLLNYTISDQLMHKLVMTITAAVKEHPENHELSRLLYLYSKRIYNEQILLEQSFDYLNCVNQDTNQTTLPAVSLAFISEPEVAAKKAFALGFIPPSAEIIYEMLKDETQFKELTRGYEDGFLTKLFSAIFVDGTMIHQHMNFFDSALFQQIGLRTEDFPLMRLRKYYDNPQENIQPVILWEALLDSKLLTETTFLVCPTNQQLFINIKNCCTQLLDAEKIQSNPERYQQLCIALAFYRTINLRFYNFIIEWKITVDESAEWAYPLFAQVTSLLPRNSANQFELRKMVDLIGLKIEPPRSFSNEKELINQHGVAFINSCGQQTSMAKFTKLLGLLQGFLHHYRNEYNKQNPLQAQQKNKLDLCPVEFFPPQYSLLNFANKSIFIAIMPEFLPDIYQTIINQAVWRKNIFSLQDEMNLIPKLVLKKKTPEEKQKEDVQKKDELALVNLYLEYCRQELRKPLGEQERNAYQAFVEYWTNPQIEEISNVAANIRQHLDDRTDGLSLIQKWPKQITEEVNNWDDLRKQLQMSFLNVTSEYMLQTLIKAVNKSINAHSGNYKNQLVRIRNELRQLVVYLKTNYPNKTSQFNEEKCDLIVDSIKQQLITYQKHLTSISKEIPSSARTNRAQKKLQDLRGMITFNETLLPSAQLIDFNKKFSVFQQKFSKGESAEKTKEDQRFWRRITWALLTVGIYAIVRGTQLGSPYFWKTHKGVLAKRMNEATALVTPK